MLIMPKESKSYHGFYIVEEYPRYVISKNGILIDTKTTREVAKRHDQCGYLRVHIRRENGLQRSIAFHRLLCMVFKNDGRDFSTLEVNHLDGVKDNNSLDNLEWCTPIENAHHAGRTGLSKKCIPVQVLDINTGICETFPSAVQVAEKYGMTRDAIIHRVHKPETRVWPEKKRYRWYSDIPWIPVNADFEINRNGVVRPVLIKNLISGEEKYFGTIAEASIYLKCAPSILTRWITQKLKVIPGYNQAKWAWDTSPWIEVEDPKRGLYEFYSRGIRKLIVTTDTSGKEEVFDSIRACCLQYNLRPSALSYRLKFAPNTFFDGLKFRYQYD